MKILEFPQVAAQSPPETSGRNNTQIAASNLKKSKNNAGKILRALAATLLLFCVCEAAARVLVIGFLPQDGPSPFFDRKLHLAKQPPKNGRPSLLFIGTSIGCRGIYADLISAKLRKAGYNLDVRNLCTVHSRADERLFVLQTAIASGAKPLLVACDFDPVDCSTQFQRRYGQSQQATVIASYRKTGLASAIGDQCYLIKFHEFLHSFLSSAPAIVFRPEQRFDVSGFPRLKQRDLADCSEMGWPPNLKSVDRTTMDQLCSARGSTWFDWTGPSSDSWFSLDSQRPLIDYCAARNIPLVFVFHPTYPPTEGERASLLAKRGVTSDQVADKMRCALAAVPNTSLLDSHDDDHDYKHYVDTNHLNPAGAIPHSEVIANALLLPPYERYLAASKHKLGAGK